MATCALPQREACREKLRLASEYGECAAQYSDAVKTMQQRMGVLSKTGYNELLRSAEEARERAEKARLALSRHAQEHGC